MKLEEIEEFLNKAYRPVNYAEDTDYEQAYYNGNISSIRRAIKNGTIDPEMLTHDMLVDFVNDGIDRIAYDRAVEEHFEATGGDIEQYKADRARIIEELKPPAPKAKVEDYGIDDEMDDAEFGYDELAYDESGLEDDMQSDKGPYPETSSEAKEFLEEAAKESILPQNTSVKNNWMTRIKEWINEKLKAVKDKFER